MFYVMKVITIRRFHSQFNVLTLRSSVFICGDLMLKRGSSCTLNMTSATNETKIFFWSIASGIPIPNTKTRTDLPGFQTTPLSNVNKRSLVVMTLESFHAILWFDWHTYSGRTDFELSKIETAFWRSFKLVRNWRFVTPRCSFSQSPHGIEYTTCVFC